MTAANYIAIAALVVSLAMCIANIANIARNGTRAAKTDKEKDEEDARKETAEQTGILIALDNIKSMLSDIKAEINSVKQDTRENHDKLLILEQSYKSEHKRIDEHEQRLNHIEEALRSRE